MSSGVIAKPQLRRLHQAKLKVGVIGACVFASSIGLAWKLIVMDPRKRSYEEFYKTYDPVPKLKIMCDAGLMQSCGPK